MNNFTIFKIKDHDGDVTKPTHSISMKIGEKYEYTGRCWTKDSSGGKFLSCSLDKPYQEKAGYHIEIDLPKVEAPETKKSTMTSVQPDGSPAIDTDKIVF